VTGAFRKLPDFLIIGAQKGGTSSLFHFIEQHPAVRVSIAKEIHYFDLNYRKGEYWYRGYFPYAWDRRITGEASPFYLFHPQVPARVRQDVPGAKVIILLRDPIERAFSHYRMNVKDGTETLSFEEALAAEELRIGGDVDQMEADDRYTGRDYRHYSYIARGFYDEQLKRWLQYFPRDQMLLLKSEGLFANPAPIAQEVFTFLGVDPDAHIEYDGRNEGKPGNIRPETRARLQIMFAPHNANLTTIAGPNFRWDDDSLRTSAAG
jgi:sulfotransferase family protein